MLIIVFTFLFASLQAISQTTDSLSFNKVFTVVEKPAKFPGGSKAWEIYLRKNLKRELANEYIERKPGEQYRKQTAIVQFIVDTLGNLSNLSVENRNDIHSKLVEEAIRVIKEGPKWEPAEQNHHKVVFQTRRYITFQINSDRVIIR